MEVLLNSPLTKRGEGVEVVKGARVARAIGVLVTLTDLLPPMEKERRKMDFPFGHKTIHGKVNLVLHGYKMNVMTHGLEKRLPSLPLGIDVQTVYATLADGSNRVTVVLRNNTRDWLEIKKGIPIAWMIAANEIPKVTNLLSAEEPKEQPTLTEAERQDLLLEKLDLTGLEAWPED